MKELKLLPEDWKGEIDYSKAHVRCWGSASFGGVNIGQGAAEKDIGSRYYRRTEDGILEELEPEPRPANSIKLSECDGRHLIKCHSLTPITIRREGVNWQGRNMNGVTQYPSNSSLALLLANVSTETIKVYDMTED